MIDLDWRSDLGAFALLAALLLTAALLRRLPRFFASARARTAISRWLLPAVELAAAATVAAWLLTAVTRGESTQHLIAGAILVAGLAWAFRTVLQDFASGIALRMDGLPEPGAWIRAAGAEGRVRRVGYRSLEIETADATRLRLPFSVVAAGRVERTGVERAARTHTFTVEIPRERGLDRALVELPALALLSPWASPVHPPEVRVVSETAEAYALELTATTLDPAFASQIEATVREELARRAG